MKKLILVLAMLAVLASMVATVGCDGSSNVYVGVSHWGPYGGWGYGGPVPITGGVVVGSPYYY